MARVHLDAPHNFMENHVLLSCLPRAEEYEVERVTTATTDHADAQWIYFGLGKIETGFLERAPDIVLANDVITDVGQNREHHLYMEDTAPPARITARPWATTRIRPRGEIAMSRMALYRIRLRGHPQVCVSEEALETADAMRDLAPGTVFYRRGERQLYVRGVGAPDHMPTAFNVYVLPHYSTDEPLLTFMRTGMLPEDVFDVHVVCGVDGYVLK